MVYEAFKILWIMIVEICIFFHGTLILVSFSLPIPLSLAMHYFVVLYIYLLFYVWQSVWKCMQNKKKRVEETFYRTCAVFLFLRTRKKQIQRVRLKKCVFSIFCDQVGKPRVASHSIKLKINVATFSESNFNLMQWQKKNE